MEQGSFKGEYQNKAVFRFNGIYSGFYETDAGVSVGAEKT